MGSTQGSICTPDEKTILAIKSWRVVGLLNHKGGITISHSLGFGDLQHIFGLMQTYGLQAAILEPSPEISLPLALIVPRGGIGVRQDTDALRLELTDYRVFPSLQAAYTYLTMRVDYYMNF